MSDQIVDDVPKGSMRAALLFLCGIVGFFAFLALVVPMVVAHGGSTDALFFVVFGAILSAIVLPILLNKVLKVLHLKGKKPNELLQSFVGYVPSEMPLVPGMGTGRELVLYDDSYGYDEEDDSLGLVGNQEEEYSGFDEESFYLIEQDSIYLAENFQPALNPMLSECTTIIGIRRSGKSNTIAVLCEELAPWNVPLVLADTEDEYSELAKHQWMPRGVLAGSPSRLNDYPGLRYIAVNIAGAYNFGHYVLDNGLQVVLNLKSYTDDNEAAYVMVELISGMNDWQEARVNDDRYSCMFVLDESQKWLPQDLSQSCLSREAQKMLQRSIFDTMVNRGGKRGLGLILGAQKPAQLDKRALQSKWKFLFRQTERIELKEYAWMGINEDEARSLRNGECFVFAPMLDGMQCIQMRLRNSPDESKTPGLASVLAHRQRLQPIERLSQRSFAEQSANEPQSGPQTSSPALVTVAPRRNELLEALEAWNNGADSVRKLASALGVTQYQAGELRRKLIEQRLIAV